MIASGAASRRLLVSVLLLAPALGLVAGCGSTVARQPGSLSSVASGDGLGLPPNAPTPQGDATSARTGASSGTGSSAASDTGSTTTSSTTAGEAGSSNVAPASSTSSASVTKGPLTIGILTTATSNASSAGASYGNTLDETTVDKALITALNSRGGIDGHKIIPVFAHTDTGTTNWSTDFNAACATFTQDNHVVAVLGYEFAFVDDFEKCLTDKRIPHLATTQAGPDSVGFKQNPYFFSLATPSFERRSQLKIDGGLATGLLSSKSKLGIVTDSCPPEARAYASVVRPYIKSKGLTIASEQTISCPSGAADASSAITALQNAMLRFRSAGVDTILFDASSESAAALFASLFAQQQGWHPTYLLSSIASTSVLETNSTPKAQEANMHVLGWQPSLDVRPNRYPSLGSAATRCLSLEKSQGIVPKAASDYYYMMTICDAVFDYERALFVSGGQTSGPAITAAMLNPAAKLVSSTSLAGAVLLSASRRDAPAEWKLVNWDSTCSCFAYTGTTHRF